MKGGETLASKSEKSLYNEWENGRESLSYSEGRRKAGVGKSRHKFHVKNSKTAIKKKTNKDKESGSTPCRECGPDGFGHQKCRGGVGEKRLKKKAITGVKNQRALHAKVRRGGKRREPSCDSSFFRK